MPDYSKLKIYTIVCYRTGKIYIGSTVKTLKERLSLHKHRRNCTAREIINNNNNYDIVLVENYPCKNRTEAELREGIYIINNPCVNKNIPGRTLKEWCQDNKEKIKEYKKKYSQDNKEKISEKRKQYGQDNKQHLKQYRQQYQQDNKEIISENKKKYHQHRNSWGGNPQSNNNLLRINIEIFK
tara:strand:- start:31 stop:579 length:549 start_codon:yes stop_codon:yes gene_type:complete